MTTIAIGISIVVVCFLFAILVGKFIDVGTGQK